MKKIFYFFIFLILISPCAIAQVNVNSTGDVGIGTATPTQKLDVNGKVRIRDMVLDNTKDSVLVVDSDGTVCYRLLSNLNDGDWVLAGSHLYNNNSGNVGIGTVSPVTKFNVVAGEEVLFGASLSGAGTKLMWLPVKHAFRAGNVGDAGTDPTAWDNANVGLYSVAMGLSTKADGDTGSVALGISSVASGRASFAAGELASASGTNSIALGKQANASGSLTIAIGEKVNALGTNSVALGDETTASGIHSTAIGFITQASGAYSTTMGRETQASGQYSTATGYQTTASGEWSFAANDNTQAIGNRSVAMGESSIANGINSHTFGETTTANARNSTAFGLGTTAGLAGGAMGSQATAFGNGSAAIGNNSTSFGNGSLSHGNNSTAFGFTTIAGIAGGAEGAQATAFGFSSVANADNSTAFGVSSRAGIVGGVEGDAATAFGNGSAANADNSTAFGNGTTAGNAAGTFGKQATAFGDGSAANADNSTAFGFGSIAGIAGTATAAQATAFGESTQALDRNTTAFGLNTIANGGTGIANQATAFGESTRAAQRNATAFGKSTRAGLINGNGGKQATAFGESTEANADNSTAFGKGTQAGTLLLGEGKQATAFGLNTIATGDNSIAAVESAMATGDNSVAIGTNVTVTHQGSFIFGDKSSPLVTSSNIDQMTMRFDKGYRFGTDFALGNGVFIAPAGWTGINVATPTATTDINGNLRIKTIPRNDTLCKVLVADDLGFVKYRIGNLLPKDSSLNDCFIPKWDSIMHQWTYVPLPPLTPPQTLSIDSTKTLLTISDGNTVNIDDNDWGHNGNDIHNLNSGNVGIGINTPTSKLDVNGNLRVRNVPYQSGICDVLVIDGLGNVYKESFDLLAANCDTGFFAGTASKAEFEQLKDEVKEKDERITLLEEKLDALINQMATLNIDVQKCCSVHHGTIGTKEVKAHLAQNIPNPFNQRTIIKYYLPTNNAQAQIRISDINGNHIKTIELNETGYGQVMVEANILAPGTYIYNLIVGKEIIDSKQMIIQK